MVDFDSMQDDSAAPAAPPNQAGAPTSAPSFDSLQDDSSKYGTGSQQAITGLEGAAQGFAGPLATYAETHLLGVKPEDIAGRAAANPWTHGLAETAGLAGGLFTGTGEAGLVGNVAERLAPEGVSIAGKIGAGAIKGMIEGGLFQGGDEISKAMLGQSDPEAPVASALANMGYAGLMGGALGGAFGGIGGKLKQLGEAKAGTTAANEIANFGSRWKWNQENPDLLSAVTQELTDFHGSTTAAADEVHGATGLKSQAIEKLSQAITPNQVESHVNDISSALENAPNSLKGEPLFQDAVNNWKSKVVPQIDPVTLQPSFTPDAGDVFKATDSLKRQMQEWGQYNKTMVPLSEVPFRNASKSLGYDLRTSLEDPKVWGQLGDLQAGVNSATTDFIPALKDFNSRFTAKLEGVPTLDPGKINTYVNQLGKPSAEIKQGVMENFVNAAEKYRDQINNLHASLGVDRPLAGQALSAVKGTFGESTPGGDLADYMFRKGLPTITDPLAERLGGTAVGSAVGGPAGAMAGYLASARLAPFVERVIGRPISNFSKNVAVPSILKALGAGKTNNLWQILDHADEATRGAQRIKDGMESMFQSGGQQAVNAVRSEKDNERLKEFVEKGGMNKLIQDQQGQQSGANPSPNPTQSFAHGGEVKNPMDVPVSTKPAPENPLFQGSDAMAAALPEQNMMMQAAKGRISNYLNSVRPMPSQGLAFDKIHPDPEKERAYDRGIDLANQPLSILNHVKNGTLTPGNLNHFTQMYPELYNHLSKKMTERISQGQMDKESPDYKTRQGMSLFLKSPLDSTMTPVNMQSIQSMYSQSNAAKQPQPQQGKTKKGTSKMGKISESLQTPDQSRTAALGKA